MRKRMLGLMTAATMLALPGIALADAIDGNWCSEKGRRISIEGSSVTTPKGARLTGSYTRHTFAFTLPAGEDDGGAPVDMVLQGEMRVRVKIGLADPQIWRRCAADIS